MNFDPRTRDRLLEILATRNSRAMADQAAEVLRENDLAFQTGLYLLRHESQPVPQRISWALEKAVLQNSDIAIPYLEQIVGWLPELDHDAERRNLMKILAISPLPEENLGALLDHALLWMVSPNQPTAVRAWCTEICGRIALLEPELKREIALSIRESMQHGSAGIRHRSKVWLKKLEAH